MRFAKMPDEPVEAPTLPVPAAPAVSKGMESSRSSEESSSDSGSSDSEEERATRLAELQEQVSGRGRAGDRGGSDGAAAGPGPSPGRALTRRLPWLPPTPTPSHSRPPQRCRWQGTRRRCRRRGPPWQCLQARGPVLPTGSGRSWSPGASFHSSRVWEAPAEATAVGLHEPVWLGAGAGSAALPERACPASASDRL